MISVLVPGDVSDYELQLQRVIKKSPLPPFDPLVIDFIDALSKAVLLDNVMRRLPEMAAVAHWMRKGHVMELRAEFEKLRGNRIWLARGVALHFAPANVDSIFMYSWFISMLIGNGNIIRLSDRRGDQVKLLLEKVNLLLKQERFASLADRSLILAYEHDDRLTQKLSESCQLRVLWGGDESVRRLRAVPMNPVASEIVFANRFSLAVLDAEEVTKASSEFVTQLAGKFFNDAYWFDQMACSSPRLVVWAGNSKSCEAAKTLFWAAVAGEVARRGLAYPEIIGLNKIVAAYASAGTGLADDISAGITGPVGRVHLAHPEDSRFRAVECGGGLFFETEIAELTQLAPLLTERDQTLSYFGFQTAQLQKLALHLPTRALDRMVPIGSALNFDLVWDGNNLLQTFSREVDLQ